MPSAATDESGPIRFPPTASVQRWTPCCWPCRPRRWTCRIGCSTCCRPLSRACRIDRRTSNCFDGRTDAVFDPSSAAAAAVETVYETLLAPERLNRLVEQQRRDPSQLGLEETLDRIARTVGPRPLLNARQAELRRVARGRYVAYLAALIQGDGLSSTAQGAVRDAARRLGEELKHCRGDRLEAAQCVYLAQALAGPVEGAQGVRRNPPPDAAGPARRPDRRRGLALIPRRHRLMFCERVGRRADDADAVHPHKDDMRNVLWPKCG